MNFTFTSNAAIDDMYAQAFDANKARPSVAGAVKVNEIAQEIENRQTGVVGFVSGALGKIEFPQFDARQVAQGRSTATQNAQSSIKDASSNVGSALKWTGGGLAALGVAGFFFYLYMKAK